MINKFDKPLANKKRGGRERKKKEKEGGRGEKGHDGRGRRKGDLQFLSSRS